jgi:hypothetical protein
MTRWCGNVDRRRGDTKEGKGGDNANWANLNLIRPKKYIKSTRSIQLLHMDGDDLKQR